MKQYLFGGIAGAGMVLYYWFGFDFIANLI